MQTVPLAQTFDEPGFSPAVRTAGRVLAVLTGLAAGAAMLLVGGLYAVFSTCGAYGGDGATCSDLVDTLDLVAVLAGTGAAIGGGVATAATGQARWIALGLAVTIVLATALAFLVGLQQPALS